MQGGHGHGHGHGYAMLTSVITEPRGTGLTPFGPDQFTSSFILSYSKAAELIPIWGTAPRTRDNLLRAFWPTEPFLAGSIMSTVSRYVSFEWELHGPARTVRIMQDILNTSDFGRGWQYTWTKLLIDLFTQDNGAFLEIVRADDSPTSPVMSINHLDSGQCVRTGRRDIPVYYWDFEGHPHAMKSYQVIDLAEFPAPVERAFGAQYSALTRILEFAKYMRYIQQYRTEKISGNFERAIHLVSGVQRKSIEDAINLAKQIRATGNAELYIQPLIVAALDPTARITKETIELASLPDDFDEDKAMKWYITAMALAFGQDYGELAPLPGGNLGSGNQSKVMDAKTKTKGPALFIGLIQQAMNYRGVMPNTVKFEFESQDTASKLNEATLRQTRATTRQIRIQSGEITPVVARQIALDEGDLTLEELAMMGERNETPDVTGGGTVPIDPDENVSGIKKISTPPKDEPPSAKNDVPAGVSKPNSNNETKKPPATSQKQ